MKSLDDLQPENPQQGFQFPGAFEVTAMGKAHAGLEERVPEIIVALEDAPEAGFWGRTSDGILLWFKGDKKGSDVSAVPNTK